MEPMASLKDFITIATKDARITPGHISLYVSLCIVATQQGNTGTIYVFSREIMPVAKLSSCATYRKCIRDLDDFGYIVYTPSFSSVLGSMIKLTHLT